MKYENKSHRGECVYKPFFLLFLLMHCLLIQGINHCNNYSLKIIPCFVFFVPVRLFFL